MKKLSDPVRLLDDPTAPARLTEALYHARSTPDAAAVQKLSGALGVPVPLAPPVVPPVSGLVAASGGSALGFLGWGGAVTVGLGAAAVALTGSPSQSEPAGVDAKASPAMVAPVAPAAHAVPAEAVVEAPASTPAPIARRKRTEPERAPSAAAPAPPVAAAPAPADAASRLREEALLVRNAERLLGADPAAALRLTDERRQRFPGGALGQEAEVVAIDALLRLGRRDAALRRARAFEASHKDSLYARRIHALVGTP
jgi:hypothetical protein